MANKILKQKALEMRAKQMSYSQIKEKLGISKSTLSGWLNKMPLSENRIKELGPLNQKRIERYRNTMRKKREDRWKLVYKKVSVDIGKLTRRELFLSGLFLYWAEGGKTEKYATTFSNTDPSMVTFFIKWAEICLGIKKSEMHIKLHLYKDMNINKYINFWSNRLKISKKFFEKPYIKESNLVDLTYKNGFAKGTCNIRIFNRDKSEYIKQSLKYITQLTIS
ncbi:MAG: helix-turn-helix domain-containing protein [bacterium]